MCVNDVILVSELAHRTWRVEQLTSNIVTSSPRVQAKEQKGNQMDEGVLRTSSHASIKPIAHNNLLWHWTLFEVRDSAADWKPVPFWPTTASHFTLSWCHSSVKGARSCHNLMRTPKREHFCTAPSGSRERQLPVAWKATEAFAQQGPKRRRLQIPSYLLVDFRTARSTLCRHSYDETSHSLHACGYLRSFLQHQPLSFVEGVLALVIPAGPFPQDCVPEIFQLRLSFLGTLLTALRMSYISFQSPGSAPSKRSSVTAHQSSSHLLPFQCHTFMKTL